MNIGDKVRFLNAVGGGRITGFQGKDLVLVTDEDGFEVPTLRHEIVVVDTDAYNLERKPAAGRRSKEIDPNDPTARGGARRKASNGETHTSFKAALAAHDEEEEGDELETEGRRADENADPADREITFRPRPLERKGADSLNLHLAFVPADTRQLSVTEFEAYFVNDSNLFVRYIALTQHGTDYRLWREGLVEPNRKVFLAKLTHNDLPDLERLTFQLISYKEDKPFALKLPLNVTLRVDGTKFYKLHTFGDSDFFDEPALVRCLVENDRPAKSVAVSAEAIEEALVTPEIAAHPDRPARKGDHAGAAARAAVPGAATLDRNAIVEVDLHAESVLDSVAGLTSSDILMCQLRVFHDTMRAHTKEHGRRIVFIHGKGEGVLRAALLKDLKRHYPRCTHQDASFREYGFGATMVTIH